MDAAKSNKKITTILLTGGPCGGKSSAIERIRAFLRPRGFDVFAIPEAATLLFTSGGIPIHEAKWPFFQKMIAKMQHALEMAYRQYAVDLLALSPETPIVIVVDRGILDGNAYVTDSATFADVLRFAIPGVDPLNSQQLIHEKYDMVLHLSTAAKGKEQFYRTEVFRNETPSKARDLDDKILDIYRLHRDRRVIDNKKATFDDKLDSVLAAISEKLNIADAVVSENAMDSNNELDGDCKTLENADGALSNESDAVEAELRTLRNQNKEQQLEIERLRAQLMALQTPSAEIDGKMADAVESNDDAVDSLKEWMTEMGVFDEALFTALRAKKVTSYDELSAFAQSEFDGILRNVRADKITKLKDMNQRNAIDEELLRFERVCRRNTLQKSSHSK